MQVCTSLQTDNHASTPLLSFFTGRMPFLPPNQQRQSTEGVMLCNERNNWLNKLATKIANVCFAGLLLDHSANFIILVFVFVRH